MVYFLPEDLVICILSSLPLKSAIRFRCVCKSWYTLLSNPKFIYKNLLFSYDDDVNMKNHRLFVKRRDTSKDHVFSFLSYDNHKLDMSLTQTFPTNLGISTYRNLEIVGSCNGFICLVIDRFARFLILKLEAPTVEIKFCVKAATYGFGFGFDSKTNDYKLIRFVIRNLDFHYLPTRSSAWTPEYEVEIYSLRKDVCPKTLDVIVPIESMNFYPFNSFSSNNGSFHWLGKGKGGYPVVLSLDFITETFRTTPLPDECIINRNSQDVYSYFCDKLLTLNESNIAMVLPAREAEFFFDIWILLQLGIKESWVKLFNIGPISGLKKPLGFWKNGDLFAETSNGLLLVYDPIEQEIKGTVQVDGLPGSIQLVAYGVSQVSWRDEISNSKIGVINNM